ncbi:hypothetical protein L6452_21485 [Arctium lappa]|uniref:Uncharacterized protein n=1 Tax=Arctium lappa TaxID=4217 RepID=A0ACB9AWR0_ARCLA|nr:hypothetical protein L6452_21485 [Arctium lappa]
MGFGYRVTESELDCILDCANHLLRVTRNVLTQCNARYISIRMFYFIFLFIIRFCVVKSIVFFYKFV